MKKWLIVMVAVAFAATFAAAQNSYSTYSGNGSLFSDSSDRKNNELYPGHWGLGLRLGIAENNPKDMKEIYDEAFDYGYSEKELTKNGAVFGIEGIYEWDYNNNGDMFGLKLGLEGYGENKLSLDWGDETFTENTYAIPLTVYYKKNNGIKNWSWIAGLGITYIHSTVEYKGRGYPTEKWSEYNVFPHITAGVEYRFSKLFALGVDLKYNIAAKVKIHEAILSNRSGIGAAITGRFYF